MKKLKLHNLTLILFFAVIMFISSILTSSVIVAQASEDEMLAFEKTNVIEDLKQMTVEGKEFNFEEYGFNASKKPQVLAFIEYGYASTDELMGDYGLYIYLYNPQKLDFNTESPLNKISILPGIDAQEYDKYQLKFLNKSEEGYEGLYYKFKVDLSEEQREYILSNVGGVRVYRVGEIELMLPGAVNAQAYPVAAKYWYSGYAKGFDPDEEESTLSYTSENLETINDLKVHPTAFRPEYTNGKDMYTQDSLHSVYFAIPKEFEKKYGNMTNVHAEWLDAVLKPALVTGNYEAYSFFEYYLGKSVTEWGKSVDYMYVGGDTTQQVGDKTYHEYGFLLNSILTSDTMHTFDLTHKHVGDVIDTLYHIYYAEKANTVTDNTNTNAADKYYVPSSEIRQNLIDSAERFGGELVNGKYAACMFESVAEEFTEMNISINDEKSLTNVKINDSWWRRLLGIPTETDYSSRYNGINAIYAVKAEDITDDAEETCEKLFIAEEDYEHFVDFFNENKETSTIYLLRYQVSDYIAQEATLYKFKSNILGNTISKVDTNAYFAQETVNLDFDVIDVTLSTGQQKTVIACVSNPVDNIPGFTPPVWTTPDPLPPFPWWAVIAALGVCACCGAGILIYKAVGGKE